MQVQNLLQSLQAEQGQRAVLDGQMQTVQDEKTVLTGRVGELEGDQGHLIGRVQQLERQNATMEKDAVSLQELLDATYWKQQEVSMRPGLHSLAHTVVSCELLSARTPANRHLPASLLWDGTVVFGVHVCSCVMISATTSDLSACVSPPNVSQTHAETHHHRLFTGQITM